jgi:hypothetical protein
MAYIMINGNKVYWEDYLELAKKLKEIDDLPKIVSGTVSWSKDKKELKTVDGSSALDNKKREYPKHVLIERSVVKNVYEFNFIDLETKEFYWSFYSDSLNYNVAKKAFEGVFKYKGVKYYLEE